LAPSWRPWRLGGSFPLGSFCDWPAIKSALADAGFTSGWATAEVPGGDRQRLADIKRRMDHVLGP
jgi:hexulose-6-phosphate isomerase